MKLGNHEAWKQRCLKTWKLLENLKVWEPGSSVTKNLENQKVNKSRKLGKQQLWKPSKEDTEA